MGVSNKNTFQEVVKEKNRMCDTLLETELHCKNCPLSSLNNIDSANCNEFIWEYPDEAERMIMKWSKENPVCEANEENVAVFKCRKCYGRLRVPFDLKDGISVFQLQRIVCTDCPDCGEEGYENWVLLGCECK